MNIKFKKGEKVICVNDSYSDLIKGKVYEVEEDVGEFLHCKGLENGYFKFCFKPYNNADKLFEGLGYEKYETKDIIQYIFEGTDTIIFEKPSKDIKLYIWNDGARELAKSINMQELQAINEKCRELGWLE